MRERFYIFTLRVHIFTRTSLGRVVIGLVALALLVPFIACCTYENNHNIPNPFWATISSSYHYTSNGPLPGIGLLDVRPEKIVEQYIHDYISIAGTFPCFHNLKDYQWLNGRKDWYDWHDGDPVLAKQSCQVQRSVTKVQFGEVDISNFSHPIANSDPPVYIADALVSYQINYTDGEVFASKVDLLTESVDGQVYYGFADQLGFVIHINCWQSIDISHFYAIYSFPAPIGVAHDLTDWGAPITCGS